MLPTPLIPSAADVSSCYLFHYGKDLSDQNHIFRKFTSQAEMREYLLQQGLASPTTLTPQARLAIDHLMLQGAAALSDSSSLLPALFNCDYDESKLKRWSQWLSSSKVSPLLAWTDEMIILIDEQVSPPQLYLFVESLHDVNEDRLYPFSVEEFPEVFTRMPRHDSQFFSDQNNPRPCLTRPPQYVEDVA